MAANTDKFIKGVRKLAGTLDSSGISSDTIDNFGLNNGAGLGPLNGQAVEITIDRVDSNKKPTPDFEEVIVGIVDGDRIINCDRGVEGTAQEHAAGAVWEIRLTADQWNRIVDGILVEHGQDGKHHPATAKTTLVDADEFGMFDSAASWILKKITFLNLKLAITSWNNPIGTIREFNVATNPATLLGIGTWAAHGTGRVTVGIDAGQTEFDTVGETGGAKTHTLGISEIPNRSGNITLHDAANGTNIYGADGVFSGSTVISNKYKSGGGTTGTSANSISLIVFNNGGGGGAHNNLQPYIVVYRWVRTA